MGILNAIKKFFGLEVEVKDEQPSFKTYYGTSSTSGGVSTISNYVPTFSPDPVVVDNEQMSIKEEPKVKTKKTIVKKQDKVQTKSKPVQKTKKK